MNALTKNQARMMEAEKEAEKEAKRKTMLDELSPYMRELNALYQVDNLLVFRNISDRYLKPIIRETYLKDKQNVLKEHIFLTIGEWFGFDNIVWVSGTVITLTIPINDRILYGLPSTVTVPYETVTVSH